MTITSYDNTYKLKPYCQLWLDVSSFQKRYIAFCVYHIRAECSSDTHSRDPRDCQWLKKSTAGSVICLNAVRSFVIAKHQPAPFKVWEVSVLLWHLLRLFYTRKKHTQTLFFHSFPFLWFHDLLQKMESLHNFSLTTSILHPLGFLPEQMAVAACRSLLVSVKVMLSGFSSSVVGTRKCYFHINSPYVLNEEYLKLVQSKCFRWEDPITAEMLKYVEFCNVLEHLFTFCHVYIFNYLHMTFKISLEYTEDLYFQLFILCMCL